MQLTSDVLSLKSARIVPWLIAVAFFMQMLDGTILNIALPVMAEDFGVSPLRMQSVVIAYMLTTALLIPASGWVADRFGARQVFFSAILIFTAGSLLCALSHSLQFMVFSRVIQGVGGAMMVPVGRLIVLKVYPRRELVRVLSFVTIPGLLGPLMGPVTGGLLVQYATWHWIFLINIPVGLIGAYMVLRNLPELKGVTATRFDGLGFLLFGLSMVMMSMSVEAFGDLPLSLGQAWLLGLSGFVMMVVYWVRSGHVSEPLFSIRLFRNLSFKVGILGNLFARLGTGAMPFLVPLFFQLGLGFSPIVTSMTITLAVLAGFAGKRLINPMLARFGFRQFLCVNTLVLGGIIACFSLIGPDTSFIFLGILVLMFGLINSMQFTAMSSVTLIDLPPEQAGSGNGLLTVTMQLASSTGVALSGALLGFFNAAYIALPEAEHTVEVFHSTFLWIGLISAVSTIIFLQTPRNAGRHEPNTALPVPDTASVE